MTFFLKAGALILMLVGLLTWLLARGLAPNDLYLAEMERNLNALAVGDPVLHRDVLSARAGVLRTYDPIVRDVDAIREALARLKRVDGVPGEPVRTIEKAWGEEEQLVEQFKTDNALLQNSIIYFDLLTDVVAQPDRNAGLGAALNALAMAVTHLAQDAGPDVVLLVQRRLDAVQAEAATQDLPPETAALVVRGRLLLELIPHLDGVLRTFLKTSTVQGRNAVRAYIRERELRQEKVAAWFRLGLYGTALLLVGMLVLVGRRLHAGATALRRRADLEHVIGLSSSRFIACEPEEIPARIDEALALFALQTGPDRAYVVRFGADRDVHLWSKPGGEVPSGWPEALFEMAHDLDALPGMTFRTPHQEDELPAALRLALRKAGVSAWSGVKLTSAERLLGMLCFDHVRFRPAWLRDTVGLLRMQGDVIGNALHRKAMFDERRALEARLRQAQRLEAIGTFTSGVAHNFNNVLGSVLGHAEMAAEAVPSGSAAKRHVGEIAKAGERARELVGQILDFGRRGMATQYLTSPDVLLEETMGQLRPVMPEVLLVASGSAGGALVMAEPAQLQQVLVNLLRNAAQASPPGARVALSLERTSLGGRRKLSHGTLEPGDYVCIAVADEGRGMDAATLAKLFQPFFTTRSAGTGLGLATASEIINESGGAFHVSSALGQGSTFQAWLPESRRPAPVRTSTGTIMLVGAVASEVEGGEDLLAALGFEPAGFTDPKSALSAFAASPRRFDLAIADKVLNGMDGLDFARTLRGRSAGVPVILSVPVGDTIEAERLRAAGVADILRRPWRSGSVVATLTRNLKAS